MQEPKKGKFPLRLVVKETLPSQGKIILLLIFQFRLEALDPK